MKDDTWLLVLLVCGIAAIGLWCALCALVNHLIDRQTVVHPRTPGATR